MRLAEMRGKKIMEGRVWVLIFCQQGLSVTMVTRQKDDVITSKGCFVWWGCFGGLAKQFIVSHQGKHGSCRK